MDKSGVLHVRADLAMIKAIDRLARKAGVNRSEAMR